MAIIENEVTVYIEDQLKIYIKECIEENHKDNCTEKVLAKAEELGLTEEEALALLDHYWKVDNDIEYFKMISKESKGNTLKFFHPEAREGFVDLIKFYSVALEWGEIHSTTQKTIDERIDTAIQEGIISANDPELQTAFNIINKIKLIVKEKKDAEEKARKARKRKGCWAIIIWFLLAYLLAFAMM